MSFMYQCAMRRHIGPDELLDAVAAAFGIDRALLVPLEVFDAPPGSVAWTVLHHEVGLPTQLDLYRLAREPDATAMALGLAQRLGSEVVCSPPADMPGNESPYVWVIARPNGEVGLADQPNPEVMDFLADVELRPLLGR